VTVTTCGALVEATVTPWKSSDSGAIVTGRTATPDNEAAAVCAGTVEFTVRLPLIGPTCASSGEKPTLIAHVPPPGIGFAQPVALKGAVVVSVTALCVAV